MVDLSGDVALETAHDVELGQALLGAPLHIGLGGLMAGHADQGDAPQGMVGESIATPVEAVTIGPPEEAGSGATPHSRAKAASLPSRPGLSPAVTSSCPAVSRPMPGRANSAGAAALTSLVSSTSRASSSACRWCQRRARARRAALVAEAGSRSGPGRRARQARASALVAGSGAAGYATLRGRHRPSRAGGRQRRPVPSSRPVEPPAALGSSRLVPHGS